MLSDDLPDELEDMSPATASVYQLIRDDDLHTRQDLTAKTILSESTIQKSLQRLVDAGLVERQVASSNPRQYRYAVQM